MTTTSTPEPGFVGRRALADLAVIQDARASLTEVLAQVKAEPFADESHAQLEVWLAGAGTAAREARGRLQELTRGRKS